MERKEFDEDANVKGEYNFDYLLTAWMNTPMILKIELNLSSAGGNYFMRSYLITFASIELWQLQDTRLLCTENRSLQSVKNSRS